MNQKFLLSLVLFVFSPMAFTQSEELPVRRYGFFGGVRVNNKFALPKTNVNLNPGDTILSYNGTMVSSIDQQNILKSKLDGTEFFDFLVWIESTRSLRYFQVGTRPTSLRE